MRDNIQLAVIGAGPAGMTAARVAARHGVDVMLFDDHPDPGGQIYRNVERQTLDSAILGNDYAKGLLLVRAFRQGKLQYYPESSVWYLDKSLQLGVLHQKSTQQFRAQRVILATGAQERSVPFPGWQLPGVMTAGAGQTILKSAGMMPAKPVVLAGSGPLLLLLAWQYLQAGVRIDAILETTPRENFRRALRYLPAAIAASDYLIKGWRMIRAIKRSGIPWYKSVTEMRAVGDDELNRIHFTCGGQSHHLDCSVLMVHQGVIPEIQIAQSAGCQLQWDDAQQCWHPERDSWGESSQSGIFTVGDLGSIVGANAAALSGQLAGLQVAFQLGALNQKQRDKQAKSIRRQLDRHLAIRPFLDSCYRMSPQIPPDETILCRCEEVSVAQLKRVIESGCTGPNQAKAFTRCGMGPCQGRSCAASVEQLFASLLSKPLNEVGRFNARPPIKPITLGQLANSEE
ncbi:MAG: FAD-dependent oxidoreductase [Pseudomonadota bacterium]